MVKADTTREFKTFQKLYGLTNKDMASICQCSLPTIQKWRSGEITPSGAAIQLIRLLEFTAKGSLERLREVMDSTNRSIVPAIPAPDKEFKDLETSMTKVMDRLELMLEGRRREKDLEESQTRYLSMVESLKDPVCRWLPDTTLVYLNKAYARFFGKSVEDLMGRKWMDLIPESKRANLSMLISDLVRRGEPEIMTHEVMGLDGRTRIMEWQDIPIKDSRGSVFEFHSVGRDVSALGELKQKVERLEKAEMTMASLFGEPLLMFDLEGNFLETNELFRKTILVGQSWKNLPDMIPWLHGSRLKGPLSRLENNEQVNFHVKIKERIFCIMVRRLDGEGPSSRFLGAFKEERHSDKVMTVRLSKEIVIGGKPVEFLMDPLSRGEVEKMMRQLGSSLRVDRVYVFTFDFGNDFFDNVLEWCAAGIRPEIENLQRVPMSDYPWWIKRLSKRQWIQFEDISQMPRTAAKEQQIITAQDIGSILVAPLELGDKIVGFAGFDQNFKTRLWHRQEINALADFKQLLERVLKPHFSGQIAP